jgi:phosphoribosylformylglycinamidine synthase
MKGGLEADVPAFDLVLGGGAPVYKRDFNEPASFAESQKFTIDKSLSYFAWFLCS